VASNSLASLRFLPSQAKHLSTTQRRLWTQNPTCSDAQSKCGGRAIKGRFRRTIGENIGDRGRTLSETERTIGETDARSGGPTHIS
jgi:hypothetical protein